MSKRYPGNYITGNPVALSQTSNNGVWDLKDQYQATGNDTWQEGDGIYEIGKSLRIRSANGNTLSRANIVAGNQKTWTMSFWIKRGKIGYSSADLMGCYSSSADTGSFELRFNSSDQLQCYLWNGGTTTNAVFRDPAAWYHIVLTLDTTQTGTSSGSKIKMYVNGVSQTFSTDYISSLSTGATTIWNGTTTQWFGRWQGSDGGNYYYDGHITEINFIDGQALDASYFGYTDSITGIWQPKRYTGSYGINGYYLPCNDNYNVYGLGNDKKETTSLGVFCGTGGIPNTAVSALSTAQSKFGGSSLQLIGYNMVGGLGSGYGTHNPMHNVDGKDFTIEFWYKGQASDTNFGSIDGVLTGYNYFCSKGRTNTSSNGWGVHLYSNGAVAWETFGASGGNSGSVQASVNVLDNNWHHIAVTRASGTVRIFIDGTQQASGTLNYTCDNTYGMLINGMWDYSAGSNITYKIGGYMDDFRMYTGIAKYTSSFTAPTAPLPIGAGDQYWGYVSCALPFDGINGSTQIPCWIPNYWTPNNLSLTAGVNYDSMVDSPTNVFTSATDVGGVIPGNYCTLNPLLGAFGNITISNAGLTLTSGGNSGYHNCSATIHPEGNKGYFEVICTNSPNGHIGVSAANPNYLNYAGSTGDAIYLGTDGSVYNIYTSVIKSGSITAPSSGDTIMVAFDFTDSTNKKLWFGRNGTWGLDASSATGNPAAGTNATITNTNLLSTKDYRWYFALNNGAAFDFNFGQRVFSYAPPTGFGSLNTTNIQARGTSAIGKAAITPNKWMDVSLYGGTSAELIVTNGGFQPDLLWVKQRGAAVDHVLYDSIRGGGVSLSSNTLAPEVDQISNKCTVSFGNTGFTAGADTAGYLNYSGRAYVAWQWKQSPTSGFNIIPYTGTGSAQTLSHNLGVAPSMVIVKNRTGASRQWCVYHKGIANSQNGAIYLNLTNGWNSDGTLFANTAPTSSSVTIGTYYSVVGETGIIYAFADVPGFSKFGSYVGNGSTDGTFIYTGFKPKFILVKQNATADWSIVDTSRNTINPTDKELFPNGNFAEQVYTWFDVLSNGFKARQSYGNLNASGGAYIYAAFAESPFGLNNRAI
jgi:hypothetical protein